MTRFHRSGRLVVLAASGWFVSACTDNIGPTAPAQVASAVADQVAQASLASPASQGNGNASSAQSNGKTRVSVLTRRSDLKRDYLVAGDIGPAGGSLRIAEAGVTISFPPNAVSQKTRITMRALAGKAVAYEFEPHGLNFAVRPTIEQDLEKTNWKQVVKGNVEGVYFADPASLDRQLSEADADEFFLISTKGEETLSFSVPHFSGYLVSSGRTTKK